MIARFSDTRALLKLRRGASRAALTAFAAIVALGAAPLGCGNNPPPPLPAAAAPAGPAVVAPAAPAASVNAPSDAGGGPVQKGLEYTENDFVESDNNRDPFRSFTTTAGDKSVKPIANQRKVELPEYAVDELKLVGIVQAGDGNSAMFLPPTGKGTIVHKGDYVGRAEIVHVGGANGPEYPINWRIEKIRDGDVVLIREDPNNSAIPPVSRVILLHPDQDNVTTKSG